MDMVTGLSENQRASGTGVDSSFAVAKRTFRNDFMLQRAIDSNPMMVQRRKMYEQERQQAERYLAWSSAKNIGFTPEKAKNLVAAKRRLNLTDDELLANHEDYDKQGAEFLQEEAANIRSNKTLDALNNRIRASIFLGRENHLDTISRRMGSSLSTFDTVMHSAGAFLYGVSTVLSGILLSPKEKLRRDLIVGMDRHYRMALAADPNSAEFYRHVKEYIRLEHSLKHGIASRKAGDFESAMYDVQEWLLPSAVRENRTLAVMSGLGQLAGMLNLGWLALPAGVMMSTSEALRVSAYDPDPARMTSLHALGYGLGAGGLEALPVMRVLRGVPTWLHVAGDAALEYATEYSQAVLLDYWRTQTSNEQLTIDFSGAQDEGEIGGIVGGIVSAFTKIRGGGAPSLGTGTVGTGTVTPPVGGAAAAPSSGTVSTVGSGSGNKPSATVVAGVSQRNALSTQQQQQAKKNAEVEEVIEAAQQLKDIPNSELKEAVDTVTDNGTIYIDPVALRDHFLAKGLTDEQIEQSLELVQPGLSNTYRTAMTSGGKMAVDAGAFIAHIGKTEDGKALTPHIALNPNDETQAEAEQNIDVIESRKQIIDTVLTEAERQQQEEDFVRQDLITQTDALKLNEPIEEGSAVLQPQPLDSSAYADFMTRYYRGIAKAFNLPVKDAYERFKVTISRGLETELQKLRLGETMFQARGRHWARGLLFRDIAPDETITAVLLTGRRSEEGGIRAIKRRAAGLLRRYAPSQASVTLQSGLTVTVGRDFKGELLYKGEERGTESFSRRANLAPNVLDFLSNAVEIAEGEGTGDHTGEKTKTLVSVVYDAEENAHYALRMRINKKPNSDQWRLYYVEGYRIPDGQEGHSTAAAGLSIASAARRSPSEDGANLREAPMSVLMRNSVGDMPFSDTGLSTGQDVSGSNSETSVQRNIFNLKDIVDLVKTGTPYFQSGTETGQKLGAFFVDADGHYRIMLSDNANLSTLLHETGHLFLEMYRQFALDPNASDALKADMQTLLKWFGVKKIENIKTKHHEQFARAFEKYLMEGKAPETGLQRVFNQFKRWLTSVYRDGLLGAKLNDDVRRVMDRMVTGESLATAATIEQLPASVDPELSAVDDTQKAEFDNLLEEERAAIQHDAEDLFRQQEDRMNTPEAKAIYEKERERLAESIQDDEVERAEAGMKAIEEGAEPSAAAVNNGFDSVEDMELAATEKAEQLQNDIDAAAQAETARQIAENSPPIHDKLTRVDKAIERDMAKIKALDTLIRNAAEKTPSPEKRPAEPIPTAEELGAYAKGHLAAMRVKDARPEGFLSSAERFEKMAAAAARKGNFVKARGLRISRVFNLALYRASVRAQEELNVLRRLVKDYLKENFVQFGQDDGLSGFRQLNDIILSGHGLKPGSGANRQRLNELPQLLIELENQHNIPIIVPDNVFEPRNVPIESRTNQEIHELRVALDSIQHAMAIVRGQTLMKSEQSEKKTLDTVSKDVAKYVIDQQAKQNEAAKTGEVMPELEVNEQEQQTAFPRLRQLLSSVQGIADDVRQRVIDTLDNALTAYQTVYSARSRDINAGYRQFYSPDEWAAANEQTIDAFGEKISKAQLMERLQHLGTAYNQKAMFESEEFRRLNITPENLMALADQHLTKRDWDFIQWRWDKLAEDFPELERVYFEETGQTLEKQPIQTVETKYGTYKGGYWPLHYVENEDVGNRTVWVDFDGNVETDVDEFYQRIFVHPSFVKPRIDSGGRNIIYDPETFLNHQSEALYFIHMHKPVADAARLLNDDQVRQLAAASGDNQTLDDINRTLYGIKPSNQTQLTLDEESGTDTDTENQQGTVYFQTATANVGGNHGLQWLANEVKSAILSRNFLNVGKFGNTGGSKFFYGLKRFFSSFVRPDTMMVQLAGDNSVLHKYVLTPLINAGASFNLASNAYIQKIQDGYKQFYTDQEIADNGVKNINAFGTMITKFQLMEMMQHLGNAYNRSVMFMSRDFLSQRRIGYNNLMALADQHLSKRDWDFIQWRWDRVADHLPQLEAVYTQETGQILNKQPLTPVQTRYGTYRGGYWQINYRNNNAPDGNMATSFFKSLFGSVPVGLQRIGYGGADIDFNPASFDRYHQRALMMVHLHVPISQAERLFNSPEVTEAIQKTGHEDTLRDIKQWLKDARVGRLKQDGWNKVMSTLNTTTASAALAYNFSSMLKQFGGLWGVSFQEVGTDYIQYGLTQLTQTPKAVFDRVAQQSVYMKSRSNYYAQTLAAIQDAELIPVVQDFLNSKIGQYGFWGLSRCQMITDHVVWLGAKRKAEIELGLSGDDAISYADNMVNRTQGSAEFLLRSAVERGTLHDTAERSPFISAMTQFLLNSVTKYNNLIKMMDEYRHGEMSRAQLALGVTNVVILEAMLSALAFGDYGEDDEDWPEWALRQSFYGALGVVPVAGTMAVSAMKGFNPLPLPYQAATVIPAQVMAETFSAVFMDGKAEDAAFDMFRTISHLIGWPYAQVKKTLNAMMDEDAEWHEYLFGKAYSD